MALKRFFLWTLGFNLAVSGGGFREAFSTPYAGSPLPPYQDQGTSLEEGPSGEMAAAEVSSKGQIPTQRMAPDHPFIQTLVQTYQTNPALMAALREQYAVAEALPTALAGFRPNLALEASTNRGFEDNHNTRRKSFASSHSGRLTLSQSLFAGGGTVAAVSAAEAQILSAYAAFAKTEQDTLLSAVNSYVSLWLRKAVLGLNRKNVSVKQKTLDQARARLEVGELTLTDTAQAESELALARSREVSAESDLRQAEENYRRIVGVAPPQALPLPSEVSTFYALPGDKLAFVQYAKDNNPTAVNARFSEEAAKHNITVAQAELLPKIGLSGSLSRNLTSDESAGTLNSRTNSGSVGLTMTVPLYQGGRNWSGYRGARQRATQSKLVARNAGRTVGEEAVQAWERWQAAGKQIEYLRVQVESAKLSLEGIRQEFLVGERALLDVLEVENKLFEAETQLAEAQANHLIQSYTLLNSLGHLTAVGLELPVEPYPLKAYVDTLRSTWFGTVADPQPVRDSDLTGTKG